MKIGRYRRDFMRELIGSDEKNHVDEKTSLSIIPGPMGEAHCHCHIESHRAGRTASTPVFHVLDMFGNPIPPEGMNEHIQNVLENLTPRVSNLDIGTRRLIRITI